MSEYNVGDRFLVEITEIDDSGMGTTYWLNDRIRAYNDDLAIMEMIPPVEEETSSEQPKATHTLDDIRNRIMILSKLLANSIETYEKVKQEINGAVDYIDSVIEDMGGDSC